MSSIRGTGRYRERAVVILGWLRRCMEPGIVKGLVQRTRTKRARHHEMASPHRRLALITLTVLMGGLLAVGIRLYPTVAVNNPNATLQVTRELAFASNASGAATITLTATLTSNISSLGTPIAWEIEGGPADTDGATPNQPDFRCVANASNQCSFAFTSASSGIGLVRAWVDPDSAQPPVGTNEADMNEGRLSDSTPL